MISKFDDLVWQAVNSYPPPLSISRDQWFSLINAIIQKESTFNPQAVSYTGAGIGLMQVNPNIWLTTYNVTRDQLFDPWTNIAIGTQIARDYIRRFGTSAGLGAYFAGPAGRLSDAAQSYARTVLSYYQNFIQKMKTLFSVSAPKPGEAYFLPTTQQGQGLIDVVISNLPEAGEEMIEPSYYDEIYQETDDSLLWIGLAIGIGILWLNR